MFSPDPKYRHICLVSDQNAAELLGAKLPDLQAAEVCAIVTPKMGDRAAALQKTCARHGIKCSLHKLEAMDLPAIEKLLDEVWLGQPEAPCVMNITGGTKMMALAAFAWASQNGIDACYIDTGGQTVLRHTENGWQKQPLPDLLTWDTLLNLYGYEIEGKQKAPVNAEKRRHLEMLLELAASQKGRKAFHALNERAASAANSPHLSVSYYSCPGLQRLLAICETAGALEYTDSQITFRDEEARKWCNGIWLEEFVQSVLAGLEGEGKISSWASSVRVLSKGSANELDAVFTRNNRLYVLECKTAKMTGSGPETSSILYKADSIRGRLGGIFAKSMLCSVDPLMDTETIRAKNLGIGTVIGANLKNLRKILMEWTNTQ